MTAPAPHYCTTCGHRLGRRTRRDARPLADRFWPRVDRTGECWVWRGGRGGASGAGAVNLPLADVRALGLGNCRIQPAHRVAWALERGEVPAKLWRTCATVACCRPDHYASAMPAEQREALKVRLVGRARRTRR